MNYSRLFTGGLLFEGAYNRHEGEVSDFSAIRQAANTVIFRAADARTLADEQLGGFGQDIIDERNTQGVRGTALWTLGRHTLKGGVEWARNDNFRNTTTIDSALQWSFSSGLSGLTGTELGSGSFSNRRFNPNTTSDFTGLINTINGLPNRNAFYTQFDVDGNGTITPAELGSRLSFSTPNPDGGLNYARNLQVTDGPQETRSDGLSLFVQDQVTFGRFTLNAGLRAEQWKHFATTGANIFTFDWELAPRVSVAYDLVGDGRQKVYGYSVSTWSSASATATTGRRSRPTPTTVPTATRTRTRTRTSRGTCSTWIRARPTPTRSGPATSRTSSSSPGRT